VEIEEKRRQIRRSGKSISVVPIWDKTGNDRTKTSGPMAESCHSRKLNPNQAEESTIQTTLAQNRKSWESFGGETFNAFSTLVEFSGSLPKKSERSTGNSSQKGASNKSSQCCQCGSE